MLNKKYFAVIAIIAAAAISVVPLMEINAQERGIEKVNEVQYDAIMPIIVDMKPGEIKIIPVEIRAKSALTVDLFISAEGKEDITVYNLDMPKFTEAVSATISKQRSSFSAADQADNIDIVVTVSKDAKSGQYPLTLTMTQKITGGTNQVQQYLYINVE